MNLCQLRKQFRIILSGLIFVCIALIILPISYFFMVFFLLKGTHGKLSKEKIKWAPLCVPLRRRLQTLSVGILAFKVTFLVPLLIGTTHILFFNVSNFWRILLIFFWFVNCYDHHTRYSVVDGIGCKFMRTGAVGRYSREYFPVELIKTVELKPNKNYLLACFPHGVLSIAPTINCALDIEKWLELFPGIRPKVTTLDINLCIPILRQLMMSCGYASTSREGLLYYLNKSNDPNHEDNMDGFSSYALAVAVGGAQEASEAQPGYYKLTLKNRKGFVKIAIMTGSSIVPSFCFNEVDSYDQIFAKPGSMTYLFQKTIKNVTNVWPSMVVGRGFFQYTFGVIPKRNRLVQVVGAPIEVKKCATPDAAYVDEIHQQFTLAIQELFEAHKEKYIKKHKDVKLIIS